MTIEEMREEANFLLRTAKQISEATGEDGTLTDEQRAEISENRSKAKSLLDQIDKIRDTQKLQSEVGDDYDRLTKPEARVVPQSQPGEGYQAKTLEIPSAHPKRYESFKGKDGARDAYMCGMWVRANLFGDAKSGNANHPKVAEAKRMINDYFPELRALGTNPNAAGGATVPQEMAAAVIERREQFGVYERFTNRVSINDQALFPRITSDQSASFSAENVAITEANATFDNVILNPKPLTTISLMSNQLINASAVDIGEVVATDIARRFAKRLDTAGFNGGITVANNIVNGHIEGAVQVIEKTTGLAGNIAATGNTFAAVTQADITELLGILPQYAGQASPFWFCSNAAKEGIFGRLQMASGGVTKLETTQGTFDSYMGVPIATTQLMLSATTAMTTGDVFLLLADLRLGSYMGVSEDLEIATSTDRYFELNQTAIRGVMRVDIVNYDFGSTTAGDTGSIVGLRST